MSDKTKISTLDFDFDTIDDINIAEKQNYTFSETEPQNVIINFYTSGTSSTPKIIKKSLYNLICEAKDIAEEFDFKSQNYEIISTTTMCHLFGMTFHLMLAICNGLIINTKEVAYSENVDIENAILVSTPSFLNTVSKHEVNFIKPPKYIISAGSKLDNKTFEYLEKKSKIIEIYGSTESGVIAHKTHCWADFELFKNVNVIPDTKSTKILSQYSYENECRINDKVEVQNRNLKIKNRTDRIFKIQEKRISAIELENHLKLCKFVNDCYILKHDEKLGCICALSNIGHHCFKLLRFWI